MVSEEHKSDIELDSEDIPVPNVQPAANNENTENKQIVEKQNVHSKKPGKPRHRKKALNAEILKQMEFYFSDSNLNKDRFLAELIKQDPNVDIEVFLKCNKIRALTDDTDRIAKALKNSTFLKVSEDGKTISRLTPVKVKEDADDCTVYVQKLPLDVDHEMLKNLFTQYGPVAYVSIPKFHFNKKPKGYAFIEFENIESAKNCLKAFREKGYELPSQTTPDELLSITTFESNTELNTETPATEGKNKNIVKTEKAKDKKKRKKSKLDETNDSESDCSKSKKSMKEKEVTDNSLIEENKKIKYEDSDNEVNKSKSEEKRSNKRKVEESCIAQSNEASTDDEQEKKVKSKKQKIEDPDEFDERENLSETLNNESENDESMTAEEKQKKKKRKRNKHHHGQKNLNTACTGMQVMSKKEWKKLRNNYLNLQRKKMSQLKQYLRKPKWNQYQTNEKNKNDIENDESNAEKKEDVGNKLKFIPGVIIKIDFKVPCSDIKKFKMEIKSNSNIQYVDMNDDPTIAYVRCDLPEAAIELSKKSNEEKVFSLLQGDEEKEYWEKILKDRETKIGKKIRVKHRGRDKLLKKAENALGKHIKFDEV